MDKAPITLHLDYAPQKPGKGRSMLTRIYLNREAGKDLPLHKQPGKVERPGNGTTFSLPFIIENRKGAEAVVRLRTREDDIIAGAGGRRRVPTARAVKMANAIMVERLLTTGKFGSATALAKKLGVSQPHLTGMLNMLNMDPEEIERILFETR